MNLLVGHVNSRFVTFDCFQVGAWETSTGFLVGLSVNQVTHSSHFGYGERCFRLSYTIADLNFKQTIEMK